MDAKALAKSKRAHSQHHSKKSHPNQKPKLPSTTTSANDVANVKKQTGKQIREKAHQAQRVSTLPSNWDRYEEEFDSGSEDQSGGSASQVPDVIVPKSKGADFRHLVAEARSQLQSNPYSDTLPSLDDFLPGDFNRFVGSILSVRGEGILSWIGNDNFVVEDGTTVTPEASFLSLNLHALAEQLEKIDLSESLFIEKDLLPPELVNSNQEAGQLQTTSKGEATAQITEEVPSNDIPEKVSIVARNVEHLSFDSAVDSLDSTLSDGGLDLEDEVCGDFISSQHGNSGKSRTRERSSRENSDSAYVSNKKVSAFEAGAAEAELDTLLDSFDESKLLDSSSLEPNQSSTHLHKEAARKGVDLSKPTAVTSKVDDLLRETSTTVKRGVVGSSKSAAVPSTLDDALDELLQETSPLVNQNDMDAKATPDKAPPSSSHSVAKSKVLKDFDSWLDTI